MNLHLFIVITDFNGFQQTKNCLNALRKSIFQGFTVVVVDHGTTSDTKQSLEREYLEVVRIVGSPELWWTGATNLGIHYALSCGADLVMLLNNDCYVTPGAIGELIELWQEHPQSLIAPVQRDWKTGDILSITPRSCFLLGFPTIPGPRVLTSAMFSQRLLPSQLIGGGRGVLLPTSIFKEIGFFDEVNLPHYWADHDFYLRACKQGIPLFIASRAIVDIDGTRTTMADNPGQLTLRQWMHSLRSIRSHRNLAHLKELFKRHYPYRQVYMLGVVLYTGRYFAMYLIQKIFWRNATKKAMSSNGKMKGE